MSRYLLDTNIVSDLVRNPQGRVAQRIGAVGEAQICTSVIVAAELRYGAAKRGSPRLTAQLEQAGQPIGGNDLLIAAQALALGLTMVTDNEREFGRIGELACENWLRDA